MTEMHAHAARSIANHFFWMFMVQGILALLMAFLILLYPPIIVLLVATMFLWIGIAAFAMAWRVRKFWQEAPDLFT